jgi:hypothetical protein
MVCIIFCYSFLPTSSKKNIKQLAIQLVTTLFTDENDAYPSNENETDGIDDAANQLFEEPAPDRNIELNEQPASSFKILQEKLRTKIFESNKRPIPLTEGQSDITKQVKQEFTVYEASLKLGPRLEKLLSVLKTIQPTSTEAERVFSLSSNICTKKRTSLSDNSLNALCVLKTYFISKRKQN